MEMQRNEAISLVAPKAFDQDGIQKRLEYSHKPRNNSEIKNRRQARKFQFGFALVGAINGNNVRGDRIPSWEKWEYSFQNSSDFLTF